jgi:hypothetical protein
VQADETVGVTGQCRPTGLGDQSPDRIDRWITQLPPRLRWAAGAVRLTLREPADGLDRALVRVRGVIDRGQANGHGYTADPDWHGRVHQRLGLPWPCMPTPVFEQLWAEVGETLRAQGLSLGRGGYGGWDDADPGFARAVWCLTSHLRPARVVETGVARGITSRIILEALGRTGTGHLWSIDLPATDPTLHDEIGIAVPERLYARWTYLSGTSRRRLPGLLADVGPVDLFVHDSSHTERNVRFELDRAWDAIRRGAVVADDIQQSAAFAMLTHRLPSGATFVVPADDAKGLVGIALKGL